MGRLDRQGPLGLQELMVLLALRVQQEASVQPGLRDQRALLEIPEPMEQSDLWELLDQ